MLAKLRFVSAKIGYVTPSIPPLFFGVFNQAKCTSLVSHEAPITIVFLFSNSSRADWKACNSVGQTKVKSFGYQNKITFLLLLIASSKMLILKLSPIKEIASTVMFGNFFPTNAILF